MNVGKSVNVVTTINNQFTTNCVSMLHKKKYIENSAKTPECFYCIEVSFNKLKADPNVFTD